MAIKQATATASVPEKRLDSIFWTQNPACRHPSLLAQADGGADRQTGGDRVACPSAHRGQNFASRPAAQLRPRRDTSPPRGQTENGPFWLLWRNR